MLEKAVGHLHAWTSGDLRFDEHIRPVKYVFAPDGRLVLPMMVAMLQATETVVHVPRADETAMELLVGAVEFDEEGPEGGLADRWRIYHGDPPDVHWACLTIDLARFHGMVIDGEAIQQANPFASLEPAALWRTESRSRGSGPRGTRETARCRRGGSEGRWRGSTWNRCESPIRCRQTRVRTRTR